jgi:sugar/nucleoside kinase (ribokinase family)
MLAALGVKVRLVTGLSPDFDRAALAGLDVCPRPIARQPRYANSYDAAGARTQLLLERGPSLDITAMSLDADLLFVAPAYHELRALPPARARLVAVSLQGALRSRRRDGSVHPHPRPWAQARPLVAPGSFAFFSDEDTPGPERLARRIAATGATAIVTRGWAGATVVTRAEAHGYPAMPARPIDPTGAGDCFAAAFAVRYLETRDRDQAARFALAAGALATEGPGLAGIPARAQVEARLAKAAA